MSQFHCMQNNNGFETEIELREREREPLKVDENPFSTKDSNIIDGCASMLKTCKPDSDNRKRATYT